VRSRSASRRPQLASVEPWPPSLVRRPVCWACDRSGYYTGQVEASGGFTAASALAAERLRFDATPAQGPDRLRALDQRNEETENGQADDPAQEDTSLAMGRASGCFGLGGGVLRAGSSRHSRWIARHHWLAGSVPEPLSLGYTNLRDKGNLHAE
jgi:hypothetical protein